MDITIHKSKLQTGKSIQITGSKSESNRLLLLQALYPKLIISNLSNSDDTQLMQNALSFKSSIIDIHHAGTAMRFLSAYFAIQDGEEIILTGSSRMKERPIKILVDALKHLGANIEYLENLGFPPLKIKGKNLSNNQVTLKADVSSQYISALLLIGSKLEKGIILNLEGTITSVPYIKMTLSLLDQIGFRTSFIGSTITVQPYEDEIEQHTIVVESDWSSASYYYSCMALSPIGSELTLSSYKMDSLQGDSVLSEIYEVFGVDTSFNNGEIILCKSRGHKNDKIILDLSKAPDIAQTIAVTAFGLNVPCELYGLHTLKIKETDRLIALNKELQKLGANISVTSNSLWLDQRGSIESNVSIATYNDHRMAMAFAPLGLITSLTILNADVVSKSYPAFWEDLMSIGFQLK